MTVFPICTLPDTILRRKAKKVSTIDGSIKKIIANMLETLHADTGRAGLAAPQIGIPLRVVVISLPEEPEKKDIVLVNPQIIKKTGERLVNEGCLSVPGYYGEIKRAESVTVKGLDQHGKEVRIKGEGLLAQVLEHEIDHLNGQLYLDHLESPEKLHRIETEETEL